MGSYCKTQGKRVFFNSCEMFTYLPYGFQIISELYHSTGWPTLHVCDVIGCATLQPVNLGSDILTYTIVVCVDSVGKTHNVSFTGHNTGNI